MCTGGAITVDENRNSECYGRGTTVELILSGQVPRPHAMLPLYKKIAALIKGKRGAE